MGKTEQRVGSHRCRAHQTAHPARTDRVQQELDVDPRTHLLRTHPNPYLAKSQQQPGKASLAGTLGGRPSASADTKQSLNT